jgi:hypothetical protein
VRDPRDIIAAFVASDEAADEPQMFHLYYTGNGPVLEGANWPEDEPLPSTVEVDNLEERNWVRIDTTHGKSRSFAITATGQEVGRARARQLAATAATAVSLDWPAVSSVLDAFHEAYTRAGAPEHGVETETVLRQLEDPSPARAAVRELVRGGYLEELAGVEQSDVPTLVRPTTATLQMLAGWPGGNAEAALDEFVAMLDQAIEAAPEGEERSRLKRFREGLVGAARDVALAYFERKVLG